MSLSATGCNYCSCVGMNVSKFLHNFFSQAIPLLQNCIKNIPYLSCLGRQIASACHHWILKIFFLRPQKWMSPGHLAAKQERRTVMHIRQPITLHLKAKKGILYVEKYHNRCNHTPQQYSLSLQSFLFCFIP